MDRQQSSFERTKRYLVSRRRHRRIARLKRRSEGASSALRAGWRTTFLGY